MKQFVLPAIDDLAGISRQWVMDSMNQNLEASTRTCDIERMTGASRFVRTVALQWDLELLSAEKALSDLAHYYREVIGCSHEKVHR